MDEVEEIFLIDEEANYVPVAELERNAQKSVRKAFRTWLDKEGKDGRTYVVMQRRSPKVTVKEIRRKTFAGF